MVSRLSGGQKIAGSTPVTLTISTCSSAEERLAYTQRLRRFDPFQVDHGEVPERQWGPVANRKPATAARVRSSPSPPRNFQERFVHEKQHDPVAKKERRSPAKRGCVGSIPTGISICTQSVGGCALACQVRGPDSTSGGCSQSAPLADRLGGCLPSSLRRVRLTYGAPVRRGNMFPSCRTKIQIVSARRRCGTSGQPDAITWPGKSCATCGSRRRLEVDHVDPAQKVDHRIWSWKKERRTIELAKCQVLCRKCHQNKTRVEHLSRLHHGETLTLYERHGCRCEPCKARKSLQNAKRSRRSSRDGAALAR